MTLRSRRVVSFSPRGIIGHLTARNDVVLSNPFRQFLDQLRFRFEDMNEPTGLVKMTLATVEPEGWFFLNGQTLAARNYPDLVVIFGETGGVITLPDYTGRMAIGAGGSVALKGTAGADTVTLAQGNLPNYGLSVTDTGHTHSVTDTGHAHAVTDAGHAHAVTDPGHGHGTTESPHSHGVTDPGHTHSAIDKNATTNVTVGSDRRSAVDGGTTGSSTTGISVNSASTGVSVNSGTTGVSVDGAATGVTVDSQTTGVEVDSTTTGISVNSGGGDESFSILPPVFGVNWLVKA